MGGCCCENSSNEDVIADADDAIDSSEQVNLLQYGERLKYDRTFKGPLAKRSCTDVFCLLIFIVFLAAWGYIGNYAIRNGDLNKLLVPTDSFNRKCGVDGPVIDKKFLFFFNLEKCIDPLVTITGCPTPQVCVSSCPTETFVWDSMKNSLSMEQLKEKLICQTEYDKTRITTKAQAEEAIKENRCARWYVKSTPLSKRCVPSDVEDLKKLVNEIQLPPELLNLIERMLGADLNGVGAKIVEDIVSSWHVILLALVVTMMVSLIFISLMRWVATPIVWLSILGVLVGLGFGVYYSVMQYNYWKATPTVPYHSFNLSSKVKNVFQQHTTWLYTSIVLGIALLVILLLVIVLRSRIRIAIALVKEGSKAVSCVVSTVFFPIFPWFLYVCTITVAVGIGLYLASIGEASFKVINSKQTTEVCRCEGPGVNYTLGASCEPTIFQDNCFVSSADKTLSSFFSQKVPCVDTGCYFEGIGNPPIISYFQAYNVIGFFWLSFFISALGDMVLAATFATWYWTFHKSDVPVLVLTRAFGRTIRYHLGTLALGAFILTICRIIRLILEYIDQKLKKWDNSVTRAILCCLKCFFWCLENFLRFINRNAYIMCAIHGNNFCTSAKDAFNLLMRNFLRVIAVDKVTDFLFFLSKLLLTGAAGVGTYYYFATNPDAHRLNYTAVPISIVVIATFLITSVFFGVYSMAVDTLFLCFLEDCERNDGTEEKPYFMSKQLMRILHKSNKMPKQ